MILHPLRIKHQHINRLGAPRRGGRHHRCVLSLPGPAAMRCPGPRPGQREWRAHRAVVAAARQPGHVLLFDEHMARPMRPQRVDARPRVELPTDDARGVPEQREVPAARQRAREEPRAALQRLGAPHLRRHPDIAEQVERQRLRPRRGAEHRAIIHPRHPPPHHIRVRLKLQPLLDAHRPAGTRERHGHVRMGGAEPKHRRAGEQCPRQQAVRGSRLGGRQSPIHAPIVAALGGLLQQRELSNAM